MAEEQKTVLMINAIVNKENTAELPIYLNSVMQLFGKHGGKPIARFKTTKNLVGDTSPEMTALIEFANAENINTLISGDDFNALADLRSRVFSKLNMMICESF